jgi:hypothetical protein
MPVTGVVNLQRKLSTGPPRPPRRRSFLAPAAEIGSISSGRKDLERPLSDCSPTLPNDRPLSDEYESPLTGVLNDLLSGKYDGGVNIKRALHGSPASTSTGICDEAITPAAVEVDDEDPFAYESVLARRSTTVVINSAATSPSTKTAEVAADGFRAAWPQRVVS